MSSGIVTVSEQTAWAEDLLDAVGDSDTSTSTVVSWLQANLGKLNYYLHTDFATSGSGAIVPELTSIQSGIYNEVYICNWLQKQSRLMVGSMTYDWTHMEGEDQGGIRRVSNTEKGKTYRAMAKDCQENLKDLIKTYKGGDFAIPRQHVFNNRTSTPQHVGLVFSWSEFNPAITSGL